MTATMTAEIAITSGYYIPDYIETGYFAEGTTHEASASLDIAATISADGAILAENSIVLNVQATTTTDNERIRETNIAISGAMTASVSAVVNLVGDIGLISSISMTTDADRTRDNDIALSNIVNLSLQAAITADAASTLSTATTLTTTAAVTRAIDSSLAAVATISALPSADANGEAYVNSAFTLSADAEKFRFVELEATQLPMYVDCVATAIEYIQRESPRPLVPTYESTFLINGTYSTAVKKFGTYAAIFGSSNQHRYEYTTDADIAFIDNNNEWVCEFFYWYNAVGTRFDAVFVLDDENNTNINDSVFRISSSNTYDMFVVADEDDGTSRSILTNSNNNYFSADQTWHHLLILWSPTNGFKVYRDGSQIGSLAAFNLRTVTDPRISIGSWDPESPDTETMIFDELRILKGPNAISNSGYTFSNSSQTVPTSAFTGTSDTQLLLHFENNSNDDDTNYVKPAIDWYGDADITTAFTVSADVGLIADITSLEAGTFSVSVDANVIKDISAALTTQATTSATTGFLKDFVPDLDAVATQISVINKIGNTLVDVPMSTTISVEAVKTTDVDSAMSTSATTSITTDDSLTRDVDSAFTTNVTFIVDADEVVQLASALDSAFSLSADVNEITQLASALDSAFTQTTNGIINVEAEADIATSVTLVADNVRVRYADATFNAFAATLTSGSKIGDYLIDIPMSASLTVDANVKTGNVIGIDSAATISADLDRYRLSSANLDSAFIQVTDGIISVDAASAIDATTTTSVDAVKTVDVEIAITGAMSFATTAKANRAGEIDVEMSATLAADAVVTRGSVIELNTVATVTAQQTTIRESSADFAISATVEFDGKIITLLEELEYVIPSETREFAIRSETREYAIEQETREYTVQEIQC